MLLSKKKKTQRDRAAGLVFRWRGDHPTNRGGGTLALCLTSAVFAGGFLLLNVSAKPNTVPSRFRASIIQLDVIDDRLAWWIERNSPLVPMRSLDSDEESVLRIDELLLSEINANLHRSLGYQELKVEASKRVGVEMFSLNSDTLPSIKRLVSEDIETVDSVAPDIVKWNLEISASDGLKDRLPKELSYNGWMDEPWLNGSVRFSVAVDHKGKVLIVNSVDWLEDDTAKRLENWLYAVAFDPLKKTSSFSTMIGVVEFRSVSKVVPSKTNGELEVREEQP